MNFIPLTFFSFSFFILGVYGVIIFKALHGLKKIRCNTLPLGSDTSIEVIIPYHNEIEHLPHLIQSLAAQTHKNYRVIWVNDHSNDGSEKYIQENNKRETDLFIQSPKRGKKAAINHAIKSSNAELIVFTDADCQHHPDWLSHYATVYDKSGNGLYFGSVTYETRSFIQQVFAVEFLSLMGTGMGLAGAGHPVFMNGANYAISSDLIKSNDTKDGQKFASGDDVFLLHQIKKKSGSSNIYPLINEEVNVKTPAPHNLKSFINQRIRWGSKSRGYKDLFSILLALVVFMLALCQVSSFAFIEFIWFASILWILKIIIDFLAICRYQKIWRQNQLIISFLLLAAVYPFYIIFTSMTGLFTKKQKWYK